MDGRINGVVFKGQKLGWQQEKPCHNRYCTTALMVGVSEGRQSLGGITPLPRIIFCRSLRKQGVQISSARHKLFDTDDYFGSLLNIKAGPYRGKRMYTDNITPACGMPEELSEAFPQYMVRAGMWYG